MGLLGLDLDLKKTWTNLLESDLFSYNQAEMMLEKYENFLELSVQNVNVVRSKVRYFRIHQELSKSNSNLILFKG